MDYNESPDRKRRNTFWIIPSIFLITFGLVLGLSFAYGRYTSVAYTPFFGWWFFFPLFFFGFFFFFRWWGWGYQRTASCYNDYDPALETLRERLARGEITKEQFEDMRRNLEA